MLRESRGGSRGGSILPEKKAVKFLRIGLRLLATIAVIVLGLWATSPDPKGNEASFEEVALHPATAPFEEAATLAQVRRATGGTTTLLVTGMTGETIEAIDLSRASASGSDDPFAVLAGFDRARLAALAARRDLVQVYAIADLLPAAPSGSRHIGTGTNFPEHAEEASSDAVFQFPKFGAASPARTRVEARADVLLDYEVELCMRFDRPVASVEDFDAAVKGLFLCGDFTDRSKLIRLIDPDNLDSGRGFSDGKSRADFYPSGPFLVVPRNWQAFVAAERMTTRVNGEPRQDARGREMTLDFRELTAKALADMERPRFLYDGAYYRLAPQRAISPEMTLMSGTAEGVVFTQPTRGDIIEGAVRWLVAGGWLRGEGLVPAVIESFIASELASGHFLQPGDLVEHRSSRLGTISVEVVGQSAP